jgi:hypothetical protein
MVYIYSSRVLATADTGSISGTEVHSSSKQMCMRRSFKTNINDSNIILMRRVFMGSTTLKKQLYVGLPTSKGVIATDLILK